ncbi:aminodeoxychorismate/anthranilate synthase component II [Hymenobacter qilianensis]|uniref:Aminodeoxychorismate/anthranilate synthase component II n=2 Tax=Hymenobacter qilianensis TaxID=1385715 RepID=A0ACB5PPY8_9BACT|nr:aminodeoxychorismate/anthranilate synthase component II [Hymenobacter qilianensis]QNP53043.1 aminodeoxychorismate/anthranilate synthase component II [Hymenobacter qilianensis]GGF60347.1 aminodeoxychorismate/anthranilate synthase component II [Hymenobacter qilianensis]
MRLLLLDNFDSFSYNLLDYFQQLEVQVQVVRNDVPLTVIQELDFDGIVLSPGPGTPARAGVMPDVIQAYHQRVPMLGVCLGHQALGDFFGAKLQRAVRPMHGKVSEIEIAPQEPLFENLPPRLLVTRYHSLVISHLPEVLVPLAYTTDEFQEIMALRHHSLPLYGVQFHPEALLTSHGLALLGNWVKCCIIAKDARSVTAVPASAR